MAELARSIASARRFLFARRLRSVMAQNVPKSLKGARRAVAGPAGKCVPRRQPRLLKRYKPAAGTLIAGRFKAAAASAQIHPFLPRIPDRAESGWIGARFDRRAA